MMLWAPLNAPASCKSVLQMTRLHPRRALFMLKPELSFSNALMKNAVFICGRSKCCDIRSVCQSAQPFDNSVAELQAIAKEGPDHPFKPRLFFLTTNLSSSPLSVPMQLVLADRGSTSMGCAAEIDEIQKKTYWGDGREGKEADIFRQPCSGLQFCPKSHLWSF